MERWRGLSSTPPGWGRCVLTIGVFDGVHRGHRVIIRRAVERAREVHQPALVLTFDPHPSEVVRPGSHPPVLTGPRRKAELLAELGVDVLCVVPFTLEFSRLSPAQFVHEVLVEQLHASAVVVGENFRFGAKAAGDIRELTRLGESFGFATEGVGLVAESGTRFSSTAIRALVAAGDVAAAALALGRPHRVSGVVVRGDGRGREIGYPTANVQPLPQAAVPADGVYAGRLIRADGTALAAAVSVGTNPTFAGTERRVEAYVLDFSGDLYGDSVGIDFVEHLRGQVRYTSVDPLLEQIARDVEDTRRLLA
ncbi:MAG TPA: bifunctional riboflavin kinase/FAD synthetase [Mycobacteriales bacterium]|nr:bifunctional riboflavin kinase/FAD synthetase [Mycobacteriales bacterium]